MGPILLDAGWWQFEGSAIRIAAHLFFKANRYLSQINLFLFYKLSHVTQFILKSCLNKEMLVNFCYQHFCLYRVNTKQRFNLFVLCLIRLF
jgi:hypothetical protein